MKRSTFIGSLAAGAGTALVLFAGLLGVGRVGSFEALQLLKATMPTVRFMTFSVIGSSITIIALMLTLLSLSLSSQWRFKPIHYHRIWQVTVLAIASVVIGVIVMIAMAVPLESVEELSGWYDVIYYATAGTTAALGGLVVAMTILIGSSVYHLTSIGTVGVDSLILDGQDEPADKPERET